MAVIRRWTVRVCSACGARETWEHWQCDEHRDERYAPIVEVEVVRADAHRGAVEAGEALYRHVQPESPEARVAMTAWREAAELRADVAE